MNLEAEPRARPDEMRILILTSGARDASLTERLLLASGIRSTICVDVDDLVACVAAGAGAALIAEESLDARGIARLDEMLAHQPPWSDFPIVVFAEPSPELTRPFERLGNVTLLDRPVRARTMIAAIRAALRARGRQYEARNAIEQRDRFLAMLGHELRNPLAAICLATDLLERAPDKKTRAAQRGILGRQSKHLARLVDDLLDVARVTHGKIVLHKEPADLSEIVRSSVNAARGAAETARVALTTTLPKSPVWVLGDALRLEQIVNNLVGNALKYTPEGGSARVELEVKDGVAHLRVIDTGVGIPKAMQGRIFDLFTQDDRSLDRSKGGLGLGLTLVHNLVRLHGGEIFVASEGLGAGSTFQVRLATVPPPPSAVNAAPSSPAPAGGRHRVVIVEDNDDVRELLQEMFSLYGHDVATASDGPSGLDLVASSAPDVAFVDIGLPGFDGFELARRLRTKGTSTLLVALTGYGQTEDRRRALAAGFDVHVTKPITERAIESVFARLSSQ